MKICPAVFFFFFFFPDVHSKSGGSGDIRFCIVVWCQVTKFFFFLVSYGWVTVSICNFYSNVLFLTSNNEFSGIIYSLFRGRQNIFLTIFSTKFVVKCAITNLKIG